MTELNAELNLDAIPVLPRPKLQRGNFLREVFETLVLIGVIYSLVNLATVRYFIDGPSMEPSFYSDQFLLISRVHYLFGDPERGDIVVFNAPQSRPDDAPLIKRLIAMPGEKVEIRNAQVYVNDVLMDEPYTNGACNPNRCPDKQWQVGENEYFFIGDNRNNSRDSRSFGPVPYDHIVGEALIRYWPPQDWAILEHFRFPDA